MAPALTYATFSIFVMAGLTWFFSARPRWFIRIFVPAEELRGAVRAILREPHFCRGMRIVAVLEAALATAVAVATVWLALRNVAP